jgi:putative ABC transport system substrate-binding protein
MKRRDFISLLGGVSAPWPLTARAQQSALPVIGFVNANSAKDYAQPLSAFLKGLGETSYVEGHNAAIEYRWADDKYERLPTLVADLVHRQVAVIAATTTAAALVAKSATTTIPIVFETAADPVQLGLVASLNRPGGNVTGVTQLTVGLVPKELELLHELIPTAHVMALLVNPTSAVMETDGLDLHVLNASAEHDFDVVLAKVVELRAGGLVIATDAFFTSHSEQLAARVARHAVPAVYKGREFAAAGGLMSYGSDVTDAYRLAGNYTGRILKGDKPADLPVQQATKIELIVNLKAAKALGITFPLTLLARADQVIE